VSISFSESAKSTQFKLLKFQNLNFWPHSFFFSGMEPMEGREGEGFSGLWYSQQLYTRWSFALCPNRTLVCAGQPQR
jgi:hypothetical protein